LPPATSFQHLVDGLRSRRVCAFDQVAINIEGDVRPMKRLGTVEDIANAVLYFASEEAAYVTGQTIVVDGGQVLPESPAALEQMGT
jgi:NAD(P)-dependent dehydrogenase (short-subunit alcohol dehydrogenase family)